MKNKDKIVEILTEFSKYVIENHDAYKKATPKAGAENYSSHPDWERKNIAEALTEYKENFATEILNSIETLDRARVEETIAEGKLEFLWDFRNNTIVCTINKDNLNNKLRKLDGREGKLIWIKEGEQTNDNI